MQIFVINGNARCGKTTFGEKVEKILKEKGIPFLHDSSINPVKQYLKEHGWEGREWDGEAKDEFWRKAMYECKLQMKERDPDFFDRYAMEKMFEIAKGEKAVEAVLFYDIREPENIDRLKSFIRLNAPPISVHAVLVDKEVDEIPNNYADTHQDDYKYDIVIDNNGTLEDLDKAAQEFVEKDIIGTNESKSELEIKA